MKPSVFFLFVLTWLQTASSDSVCPFHVTVWWMFVSPHGATLHLPPSAVVLIDSSSETLLTCYRHQLTGCCLYIADACVQFSTISCHRWKWLKILIFFFFFFDSGGEVDIWRIFFFKAANQNDEIQLWNFLFSSITESHWSHWSVLETTDWEKDEWVQCFPLCSVTTH